MSHGSPHAVQGHTINAPVKHPARSVWLRRGDATQVNGMLTASLAVVVTLVCYAFVIAALRGTYLHQILVERRFVPYVIVYLSAWAAMILVFKFVAANAQRVSLTFDLLPRSRWPRITERVASDALKRLEQSPMSADRCFLLNRLQLTLGLFEGGLDRREIAESLRTQAIIDEGRVDSSYSQLRVLVWAIPIIGFIGTVLGIGNAVSGFTVSLEQAADLEIVRNSLGGVTSGLAIAFDTTLLALAASVVIMFPMHQLQSREESALRRIERVCIEDVLPRLVHEHDLPQPPPIPPVERDDVADVPTPTVVRRDGVEAEP